MPKPSESSATPLHILTFSLTLVYRAVLKAHQKSGFSLHLLVGSITSVVLSTRVNRPNLENEMAMEPKAQMPVTAAMTSAYNLLTSMGDHDSRFYTVVMWHWCYMHLVCDIR